MKTDALFYQIFQTFPQLVFQLLDHPVMPGYAFASVEVKEKSFGFDGIFMPPPDRPTEPIYFTGLTIQLISNLGKPEGAPPIGSGALDYLLSLIFN